MKENVTCIRTYLQIDTTKLVRGDCISGGKRVSQAYVGQVNNYPIVGVYIYYAWP